MSQQVCPARTCHRIQCQGSAAFNFWLESVRGVLKAEGLCIGIVFKYTYPGIDQRMVDTKRDSVYRNTVSAWRFIMSKDLTITIYPSKDFQCSLKNIVGLLNNAGWTITDSSGKINVWNETDSEWEIFNGTLDDFFLNTEYYLFYAYNGSKIISVYTNDRDSFSIWPEADIQKITYGDREYFDYNWYYLDLIPAFNKENTIVERVTFDEY